MFTVQIGRVYNAECQSLQCRVAESGQSGRVWAEWKSLGRVAESGQVGRVWAELQSGRVCSVERQSPQLFTVQIGRVYSVDWQRLQCRVAESIGQIGSVYCSEAEAIVQSGRVFRAEW